MLFGAGTPLAKLLLNEVGPWLLAGILYLGAGIGLAIWRAIRGSPPVRLSRADLGWLAGAVFFGGIVGPVLLLGGLAHTDAATASLLLNAEGVATALKLSPGDHATLLVNTADGVLNTLEVSIVGG